MVFFHNALYDKLTQFRKRSSIYPEKTSQGDEEVMRGREDEILKLVEGLEAARRVILE